MSAARCVASCWAMPECPHCRLVKAPQGRSVPMEATSGYCHCECYYEAPRSGHLWPDEHDARCPRNVDAGLPCDCAQPKAGRR